MRHFNEVCDVCGSKAYYIITKTKSKLYMCGSHTRKNSINLLEQGFVITPSDYNDFSAELSSYNNSTTKTKAQKLEASDDFAIGKIESSKTMLKEKFSTNPEKTIMDIFLPKAQEVASYNKSVKVFIIKSDTSVNVRIESAGPLTENETKEFYSFKNVFTSMMKSILG